MEKKIKVKITRAENAEFFHCKINDIIEVNFEEYVAAVTASEIGNGSIEVCKAQAVATRTFAMSRNVLNGLAISDSSSNAQAYRAIRYNRDKYPNSIAGAEATKGEVLFYNFEPISAVYGASNGGYTVSSQERWGSVRPYLIKQKDPWDAAAGKPLKGPGVGMSQSGASWAAKHGVNYKDILKFYYPNTIFGIDYTDVQEVKQAMENIQKPTSLLKKGSKGEQVVWLQTMLSALGFNCGIADGVFGSGTQKAVESFQTKNNLTADGKAGPMTIEVLWNQYNKGKDDGDPDKDEEKNPPIDEKLIEELYENLIKLKSIIDEIIN